MSTARNHRSASLGIVLLLGCASVDRRRPSTPKEGKPIFPQRDRWGETVYVQHNKVYSRDDLLALLTTKSESRLEAQQAQRWLGAARGASLAGVALTGIGAALNMGGSRQVRAIGLGAGIAGVTVSLGGLFFRSAARDNARAAIDHHSQLVMLQPRDPPGAAAARFTPGSPLNAQSDGAIIVQDDRVLQWDEVRQHLEGAPASAEAARGASRLYVLGANTIGVAGAVLLAGIPAVATASGGRERAAGIAIFGAGAAAILAGGALALRAADRRVERAIDLYNGSLERPAEAEQAEVPAFGLVPWVSVAADRESRARPVIGFEGRF